MDDIRKQAIRTIERWIPEQQDRIQAYKQNLNQMNEEFMMMDESLDLEYPDEEMQWPQRTLRLDPSDSLRTTRSYYDKLNDSVTEIEMLLRRKNAALQKLRRIGRPDKLNPALSIRTPEPIRRKTQVDYMLEEASWMATDFIGERSWKIHAARQLVHECSKIVKNKYRLQKSRYVHSNKLMTNLRTARHVPNTPSSKCDWSNISLHQAIQEASAISHAVFGANQRPYLAPRDTVIRFKAPEATPSSHLVRIDSNLYKKREFESLLRQSFQSAVKFLPQHLMNNMRPYQQSGIFWIYSLFAAGLGAVLGDERGLGKRITAIASILLFKRQRTSTRSTNTSRYQFRPMQFHNYNDDATPRSLVIVPPRLVSHWAAEFNTWASELKVSRDALDSSADVIICTPEEIRRACAYSSEVDLQIHSHNDLEVTEVDVTPNAFTEAPWDIVLLDMTLPIVNETHVRLGWNPSPYPSSNESSLRSPIVPPWQALRKLQMSHRLLVANRLLPDQKPVINAMFNFVCARVDTKSLQPETSEVAISLRESLLSFFLRRQLHDDDILPQLPALWTQTIMCAPTLEQSEILVKKLKNANRSSLQAVAARLRQTDQTDKTTQIAPLFSFLAMAHAVAQHPAWAATLFAESPITQNTSDDMLASLFGRFRWTALKRSDPVKIPPSSYPSLLSNSVASCGKFFIPQSSSSKTEHDCFMSQWLDQSPLISSYWSGCNVALRLHGRSPSMQVCCPPTPWPVPVTQRIPTEASIANAARCCVPLPTGVQALVRLPMLEFLSHTNPTRLSNCSRGTWSLDLPKSNVLPSMLTLKRSSHPLLSDFTCSSGKFRVLHGLLSEAAAGGQRVLLMTTLPQIAELLLLFLSRVSVPCTLLNARDGENIIPSVNSKNVALFNTHKRIVVGVYCVPSALGTSGSAPISPEHHSGAGMIGGNIRFGDVGVDCLNIRATTAILFDVCMMSSAGHILQSLLERLNVSGLKYVIQLATSGSLEDACLRAWSGAAMGSGVVKAFVGEGPAGLKVWSSEQGGMHSTASANSQADDAIVALHQLNHHDKLILRSSLVRKTARTRVLSAVAAASEAGHHEGHGVVGDVVTHGLVCSCLGLNPQYLAAVEAPKLIYGQLHAHQMTAASGLSSSLDDPLKETTAILRAIPWTSSSSTEVDKISRSAFEEALLLAFAHGYPSSNFSLAHYDSMLPEMPMLSTSVTSPIPDVFYARNVLQKDSSSLPVLHPDRLFYSAAISRGEGTLASAALSAWNQDIKSVVGVSASAARSRLFHRHVVAKVSAVVEELSKQQDAGVIHFSRLFGPPNPDMRVVSSPPAVYGDAAVACAVRLRIGGLKTRVGVFQHPTRLRANVRLSLPRVTSGLGGAIVLGNSFSALTSVATRASADAAAIMLAQPHQSGSHAKSGGPASGLGAGGSELHSSGSSNAARYGAGDGARWELPGHWFVWSSRPATASMPSQAIISLLDRTDLCISSKAAALMASVSLLVRGFRESSNFAALQHLRKTTLSYNKIASEFDIPLRVRKIPGWSISLHRAAPIKSDSIIAALASIGGFGGIPGSVAFWSAYDGPQVPDDKQMSRALSRLNKSVNVFNRAYRPFYLGSELDLNGTKQSNNVLSLQNRLLHSLQSTNVGFEASIKCDEHPPLSLPSAGTALYERWEDLLLLSIVREFGMNWDYVNEAFQNHSLVRLASAEVAAKLMKIDNVSTTGAGSNNYTQQNSARLGRHRSRGARPLFDRFRRLIASQLPRSFATAVSPRVHPLASVTGYAYKKVRASVDDALSKSDGLDITVNRTDLAHSTLLRMVSQAVKIAYRARIPTPAAVSRQAKVAFNQSVDVHQLAEDWSTDIENSSALRLADTNSGPTGISEHYSKSSLGDRTNNKQNVNPFRTSAQTGTSNRNNAAYKPVQPAQFVQADHNKTVAAGAAAPAYSVPNATNVRNTDPNAAATSVPQRTGTMQSVPAVHGSAVNAPHQMPTQPEMTGQVTTRKRNANDMLYDISTSQDEDESVGTAKKRRTTRTRKPSAKRQEYEMEHRTMNSQPVVPVSQSTPAMMPHNTMPSMMHPQQAMQPQFAGAAHDAARAVIAHEHPSAPAPDHQDSFAMLTKFTEEPAVRQRINDIISNEHQTQDQKVEAIAQLLKERHGSQSVV